MPTPNVYEAPQEYLKTLTLGSEVLAQKPKDFSDPIRMFEATGSDVDGSVRQWLTLEIGTKKRLLSQWSVLPHPPTNEDATEQDKINYEVALRNRWRTLNFVIQEESRSRNGNRDIASLAFAALFPLPVTQRP
jgi:hypothetical protein